MMKEQSKSFEGNSRDTSLYVSVVSQPRPTLIVHRGSALICEVSLDTGLIKKLIRELVSVL